MTRIAAVVVVAVGAGLLAACGGGATGPSAPSGPPALADVNGATQPAAPSGGTVVLDGQNFGSVQGSGAVLFSDGAGGTVAAPLAVASDWSNTLILTTVPVGAASGPVTVKTAAGSSNPIAFTLTQNAAFSPATISWTATSPLPAAVSGHALAFAELRGTATTRVVYVLGGAGNDQAPTSAVAYATVGGSGTLSGWTATTAMPAGLAFHAAAAATPANAPITVPGFLYVIGGATDATGHASAAVYRGALAADGTVTAWTAVTSLPVALHSSGAAIFHGQLYVGGGATGANVPVGTVYRARIDTSGALGAWQAEAGLPSARAHFGFGAFGGFLYAFGGDSGTTAPNAGSVAASAIADVAFAPIDLRTGALAVPGWTTAVSKLKKAVSRHTAVMAGGNVLITAGLYNGAATGSSEESYAQLGAAGVVGAFNGATGANTIGSLSGGANLFNHAAVGYTDGGGAFHVLVAGGDDVNAPGTKHDGVFFY
jgi:hypothetical protein